MGVDVKVMAYLVCLVESDKRENQYDPDKPQTKRTAFKSDLSAG